MIIYMTHLVKLNTMWNKSLTEVFLVLSILLKNGHDAGFEYGDGGYVLRHDTQVAAERGHVHLLDTNIRVINLNENAS